MGTRLQHWDKIEAAAAALIEAMEKAARDPAWEDGDVEAWDEVHDVVFHRPRLKLIERDRMSGGVQLRQSQPAGPAPKKE